MRRTRFDDAPCPIARTTDLIGDWWTPIVMRESFRGARRFGDFVEALDILTYDLFNGEQHGLKFMEKRG